MAYTFIYTVETERGPATIKFESQSTITTEFAVTVLSRPDIAPFRMKLDEGRWELPCSFPEQLKYIQEHIMEAARKFTRDGSPVEIA